MYIPRVVVCAALMLLLPYMPAAMPAAGQDGGVAYSTTHWSYSPVKTTTKCTTSTKTKTTTKCTTSTKTKTSAKTTAKTTTKASSTKMMTTTTKASTTAAQTTTKASSTKMVTTTTKASTTAPATTTSSAASSSSSSVTTTATTTPPTTTSSAASSSSSSATTTSSAAAATAPCSAAAQPSGCVYDVYCDSDYNGDQYDINFATTVDDCASFAYVEAAGAFSFYPDDNICYISNRGMPGDPSKLVAMPGSGIFSGLAPPGSSCYTHPVVIVDPPDDGGGD